MKKIFRWLLLAYGIAGLVYGLSGLTARNLVGKAEVISPWIGIPLDIVSWPWMVYADFKNIGILIQDALALVVFILCIVLIIYFKVRKKKRS
jgi:hypothetical protein